MSGRWVPQGDEKCGWVLWVSEWGDEWQVSPAGMRIMDAWGDEVRMSEGGRWVPRGDESCGWVSERMRSGWVRAAGESHVDESFEWAKQLYESFGWMNEADATSKVYGWILKLWVSGESSVNMDECFILRESRGWLRYTRHAKGTGAPGESHVDESYGWFASES